MARLTQSLLSPCSSYCVHPFHYCSLFHGITAGHLDLELSLYKVLKSRIKSSFPRGLNSMPIHVRYLILIFLFCSLLCFPFYPRLFSLQREKHVLCQIHISSHFVSSITDNDIIYLFQFVLLLISNHLI